MLNRRQTIVIDKKFQYQYSMPVVALTVLTVNLFVIIRMLYPSEQPLVMDMASTLGLAAIELTLIAGVWYSSLKASHKIVGPIHVFTREVSKLGAGDLTAHIWLRHKDMFQDSAVKMNDSFTSLHATVVTLKEIAHQLERAQSQNGDMTELVAKLQLELSVLTTEDAIE